MKILEKHSKNSIFLPLEIYKPANDISIPYFEVDVPIYDENFVEVRTVKYMEIELSPEYDRQIATIQLKIILMQQRCIESIRTNSLNDQKFVLPNGTQA